jgi:hypothetical protein
MRKFFAVSAYLIFEIDLKMCPSENSGVVPATILPMNRREKRAFLSEKPASGRVR